ncbi:CaiB/BaiF CoA transferase family protein [Microbacterium album]|uniref:CoA transferase n=1 Tax=Microbacterium album TaxID=2053191 RepID=A0A917MPN4_9MICO|nr:CoA transferase [Microbacterium album]GGH48475.1 CoA transferase [Microbacterium album]
MTFSSSDAPAAGPLAGVRVLDFTTFLSGPFATQILADLGAEVIKLEAPEGDSSRTIPPYFVGDDSAYYLSHNRTKRSIVVDLKQAEGVRVARDLITTADVVIENFRPGVATRLGLDPAELRAERPALIWVSISGFGQHGPWKDRPAYDMVVQALSGVMSLTGVPGGDAMRLGIPAGDLVAGMYGVVAALAALVERARAGHGRWADISMLDGQLSMLSYQAVYATVAGITPRPQASRHDSIPTYRTFWAGDGRELAVTANTQRMWAGLVRTLGLPELVDDPRFVTGADRLANQDELSQLLEQAFLARPAAEWVDALVEAGVPAALIKTVPEALDDARAAGRGMILPLSDDAGHSIETVGSPVKWVGSGAGSGAAWYPPRLGEDTGAVLTELGYSTDRIAQLERDGVVTPGAGVAAR